MAAEQTFAEQVVGHREKLCGYARKLTGSRMLVDDIVQETILKALLHSDQFTPGTNLNAWLYAIMRNTYFNHVRVSRRYSAIDQVSNSADTLMGPGQFSAVELKEVSNYFDALPQSQREALNLVAIEGNSYEDAAQIAGCACGTMKSRVSRARMALSQAMDVADQPSSTGVATCDKGGTISVLDDAA